MVGGTHRNKGRRKALADAMEQLEELKANLEEIQEEEDCYRDNMPENLQNSERYELSETASNNLSDAISSLEDVLSYIGEAIGE